MARVWLAPRVTGVDDRAGQDVGGRAPGPWCRAREGKAVISGAYYEQAPAGLRNAVVCRLHHSPGGLVPELFQLGQNALEIWPFGRHAQAGDVLHDESRGLQLGQGTQELRDAIARVVGGQPFAPDRKWLARWAAGDDREPPPLRPEIQRGNVALYDPGPGW